MFSRSFRFAPLLALALVAASPGDARAQRAPGLSVRVSFGAPALCFPAPRVRRVPVVVCPPPSVFVAGRYEDVPRDVWVPACTRRVWVPPLVETRCDLWGRAYSVEVAPGHWQDVVEPAHTERRSERVWVPAHWEARR